MVEVFLYLSAHVDVLSHRESKDVLTRGKGLKDITHKGSNTKAIPQRTYEGEDPCVVRDDLLLDQLQCILPVRILERDWPAESVLLSLPLKLK